MAVNSFVSFIQDQHRFYHDKKMLTCFISPMLMSSN